MYSMKLVVSAALACLLVGLTIGYGLRLEQNNLHELIQAMEFAKDSHQKMIDNPIFFGRLAEAGFAKTVEDEERWVEIYEQVIIGLRRR